MRPFVDFPPIIGSPVEGDILAYVLEQDPQHRPCEDSLPPLVAIVLGDTYKPPSRRKEEDTKACLLVCRPFEIVFLIHPGFAKPSSSFVADKLASFANDRS